MVLLISQQTRSRRELWNGPLESFSLSTCRYRDLAVIDVIISVNVCLNHAFMHTCGATDYADSVCIYPLIYLADAKVVCSEQLRICT